MAPEQRARDLTFWRRSNVISSRRRDQIPDPEAEATAVSVATPVMNSPRRPQRNDVFAPDPPPPTTAARQPDNKDAVASPELRPGQIGPGCGANGGFAGEMGRRMGE
jgi:hypothetical protein